MNKKSKALILAAHSKENKLMTPCAFYVEDPSFSSVIQEEINDLTHLESYLEAPESIKEVQGLYVFECEVQIQEGGYYGPYYSEYEVLFSGVWVMYNPAEHEQLIFPQKTKAVKAPLTEKTDVFIEPWQISISERVRSKFGVIPETKPLNINKAAYDVLNTARQSESQALEVIRVIEKITEVVRMEMQYVHDRNTRREIMENEGADAAERSLLLDTIQSDCVLQQLAGLIGVCL